MGNRSKLGQWQVVEKLMGGVIVRKYCSGRKRKKKTKAAHQKR